MLLIVEIKQLLKEKVLHLIEREEVSDNFIVNIHVYIRKMRI